MNAVDKSNMIIELMEVFINHILYIREIYPSEIFKKKRMYSTPVYISIYSPLNSYLINILKAAKELKETKELHKVEVVIYQDEQKLSEKYAFEINENCLESQLEDDIGLLELEERLRQSLYSFSKRAKLLPKLDKKATFQVYLHTTQNSFIKLSHNSTLQNFPWLQKTEIINSHADEISILPITPIGFSNLRIFVEIPSQL